jgi:hypothetical protein
MADLAKGSSLDLMSRLEPKVESLAKPGHDWLLQGRADVRANKDIQDLFLEKDRSPEWITDMVASRLAGLWEGNIAEASEVARYLVDEHRQLGEGIFLVSSETGKVIARIDEKDFYQPEPVYRPSGELAPPLPRLQPGMEALIVTHFHEKGREERILSILTERAHQTALLREEGDRRLWIATRAGRARLAEALGENHPKRLLELAGGSAGAFLSHFDIALTPPDGESRIFYLTATSSLRVNDPLTSNLNYDRLGTLRGVLAQGWVRDLAKQLSIERHLGIPLGGHPINISDITPSILQREEMWVTDPETMLALLKRDRRSSMYLPVDGAYTIGFSGKLGTLIVPEKFDLQSREVFGRWEVTGGLEVSVHIPDWTKITAAEIRGIDPHVEVLQ